jgi:hypothetical protein
MPGHPNPYLVQPTSHTLHSTLQEFYDDESKDTTTAATREGIDFRLRLQCGATGVTPAQLRAEVFGDPHNALAS